MEKVQKFIDDINNDLENRKRGLPTNPFEKQKIFAEIYPITAQKNEGYFCLSEYYYPENTRSQIDIENKNAVIMTLEEIRKSNSYKQDNSMKKVA